MTPMAQCRCTAQQPSQAGNQLIVRRSQRGRVTLDHQPLYRGSVFGQTRNIGDESVPQPEIVPIFAPCGGCADQSKATPEQDRRQSRNQRFLAQS
jgi:hypothetical protein